MLRGESPHGEDGRHDYVRPWRGMPLVVEAPASCRLEIRREDVAVRTAARVDVRGRSDVAVVKSPHHRPILHRRGMTKPHILKRYFSCMSHIADHIPWLRREARSSRLKRLLSKFVDCPPERMTTMHLPR